MSPLILEVGDSVALLSVHCTWGELEWFLNPAGSLHCVLGQAALLSQCLSLQSPGVEEGMRELTKSEG